MKMKQLRNKDFWALFVFFFLILHVSMKLF